jgi:large subunit ribosomal protein L21
MYAILQQSGHQYRVSPGDRLVVDRLSAEVGSVVALEPVVLVQNDDGTQVGTPVVDGARIAAVVVSHRKGAKIRVFKYKPKKRYRRTHGHRSLLTELRVEAVLAAGEPLPEAPVAAARPAPAAEAPAAPKARSRGRAKAAEAEVETPVAEAPKAAGKAKAPKAAVAAAPEATEAPETPEASADAGAQGATSADATAATADATEAPAAPKRAPRSRAKKADTEKTESDAPAAEGGEPETEA